jgi:DNA polymerase-3 subunit gamma/tau
MVQTLYRKYRPADFSEVLGQDPVVKVIKRQVEEKRIGHAYLFSGPRGTGKTSMARLLAKAVNCKSPKKGNPCKECTVCQAIDSGRFLDMIEIDAASNRGIEEIRRLKEKVGFSPSEGRYKVYIIDEVHMLTKDAFNALLKTLEEPPQHVIFILATTEPHKIPATIISRCQRFSFILATEKIIFYKLSNECKEEKVQFSKEALMSIVKSSGGSFRDAESILEKVLGAMGVIRDNKIDFEDIKDILGLVEDKEIRFLIEKLLEKDVKLSLEIFNRIVESGANLFPFMRQSLEYSRSLLLDKVIKRKGNYTLPDILLIIREFSEAESKLKYASITRLPVEMAIIKICAQPGEQETLKDEVSNTNTVEKKIKKFISGTIGGVPQKIKSTLSAEKPISLHFENIQKNWGNLLAGIKPLNYHLYAFLKKAHPVDMQEKKVVLEVPYKFYKERIEGPKSQEIFNEVTSKVFSTPLGCICTVIERGISDFEKKREDVHNDKVVLEILGDMLE